MKGLLDTVTNILQTTTSPYDDSCTQCGNTGVDTALINGIPALLCPACLDKIKQEAGGARSAFEAYNPNYGKGLTYALPAVVVSALIWAIIAYFLEVIFLFAGFLIGLFVSYALVYGTEKINGSVIGLAVVLTILAVLLGEIFAAAFALLAEGVSLSYLPDFLGWYITEYPGDFAIVMFTALIGAAYISYRLWSAGKEQRATFDVVS